MRVDVRTENSMTRHHLQGGVSGVKRGRLRGEVEPHAKTFGETKRRPIQRIGRRPGCPPAQDLVDSSGAAKMLRGGHTRKTPTSPPPPPPPAPTPKTSNPQKHP